MAKINRKAGNHMGFAELFLIGVGLSMDAFAVAVCKGLGMRKLRVRQMLVIALFFGGFQALMPLLGWFLGSQFAAYITNFDHWIAFLLLCFIGGKMIQESRSAEANACPAGSERLDLRELLLLSVATSIDALAVGITFSFLSVRIVPAVLLIGCTTFLLSIAGVLAGNFFGSKYKNTAELAGGIILVGMGVKILVEHLGLL